MAGVLNVAGSADSGLNTGIIGLRKQGADGTMIENFGREGADRLTSKSDVQIKAPTLKENSTGLLDIYV